MKRAFKWILVLCALCALFLAALRVPALQRRIALAAFGGSAQDLRIDYLSAGPLGVAAEGVSCMLEGGRVCVGRFEARYNLWAYIFGGRIDVESLSIKDVVYEEAAAPAQTAPAPAEAQAAAPFALPKVEFSISRFDISGRAALRSGTANFALEGGLLGTRQAGTVSGTADFAGAADGTRAAMRLASAVAFEDAVLPATLSLTASISGSAGDLSPAPLALTADLRGDGAQWSFAAEAAQAGARLAQATGGFDAARGALNCAFELDFPNAALAPLAAALPVPECDLKASGNFSAEDAFSAQTLDAVLSARVRNWSRADARLAALPEMQIDLSAKCARTASALSVERLRADVSFDGAQRLDIRALRAFGVSQSGVAAQGDGALLRAHLSGVPLAAFGGFLASVGLEGELGGELDFSAADGALAVTTARPLAVRGLSLNVGGADYLRGADLALNANARWQGGNASLGYNAVLASGGAKLAAAKGQAQYLGQSGAVSAEGAATVFLNALSAQPVFAQKLPAAAALPFEANVSFKADYAGGRLDVRALAAQIAHTADARRKAAVNVNPLSIIFGEAASLEIPDGVCAEARFESFDLAALGVFLPKDFQITEGALTGALTVSKSGASYAAQGEAALASFSLARGGKRQVYRLNAKFPMRATYAPERCKLDISAIDARFGGSQKSALSGAVFAEFSPTQWSGAEARAKLKIDLPELFDLAPALAACDNAAAGTAEVEARLEPSGAFAVLASCTGVRPAFGERAGETVERASLAAEGAFAAAPLKLTLSAPLSLAKDGRQSQASCAVAFTAGAPAKNEGRFDIALEGNALHIADAMALAAAFLPPTQSSFSARAQAPAPAAPFAPCAPDTVALWSGYLGQARASFKEITYGNYALADAQARVAVAPDSVQLETLSAKIADAEIVASGKIAFDKARARAPYALAASAGVSELELGKFARSSRGNPIVEGVFGASLTLSGTGADLASLFGRMQGVCKAEGRNGVLHLIEGSDNAAVRTVSGIGTIAAAFLGGGDNRVPVLTPILDALGNLKYDVFSMTIARGEDLDIVLSNLVIRGNEAKVEGQGRISHVEGVALSDSPLNVNAVLSMRGSVVDSLVPFGLFGAVDADGYREGPAFPVKGTLNAMETNFLSDLLTKAVSRTLLGSGQSSGQTAAPSSGEQGGSGAQNAPPARPTEQDDGAAPVRSLINLIDALRK